MGKNKYNNVPVDWHDWHFRSKKERNHAFWLVDQKNAGKITDFEYEKRYKLIVNDIQICTIIPDFTVSLPDGRIQVHEIKGGKATMTDAWRIKSKLFKILYPHIEYLVNPRKII